MAAEQETIAALCAAAQGREELGHCAHRVGRYWARGRGWSWVESIQLSVRQCEVDAVAGNAYLCTLALSAGVQLPHDGGCTACVERANRRSWLARRDL